MNTAAHETADPYAARQRWLAEVAEQIPDEGAAWAWLLTLDNILYMRDTDQISPGHAHALAAAVARQ